MTSSFCPGLETLSTCMVSSTEFAASLVRAPRPAFPIHPAHSVNDDARTAFLRRGKHSRMRAIEKLQNFSIRILSAAIFVHFHMHARKMCTAKPSPRSALAMDGSVAPDESAHKSKHNRRRLNVLTAGLRCPGFIRTEIQLDGIRVVSCRQSRHGQHCRRTTRCC